MGRSRQKLSSRWRRMHHARGAARHASGRGGQAPRRNHGGGSRAPLRRQKGPFRIGRVNVERISLVIELFPCARARKQMLCPGSEALLVVSWTIRVYDQHGQERGSRQLVAVRARAYLVAVRGTHPRAGPTPPRAEPASARTGFCRHPPDARPDRAVPEVAASAAITASGARSFPSPPSRPPPATLLLSSLLRRRRRVAAARVAHPVAALILRPNHACSHALILIAVRRRLPGGCGTAAAHSGRSRTRRIPIKTHPPSKRIRPRRRDAETGSDPNGKEEERSAPRRRAASSRRGNSAACQVPSACYATATVLSPL